MIRRSTLRLDGRWGSRQVHFRSAGDGAPLLLLHQSPQSSLDLESTIETWAGRAFCVAPDMPGYGLSQPIGQRPESKISMEDLADATVEFLDAIALERVGVYGFHSGAMLAVMIAIRHPSRVSAVVANGYVLLEPEDQADILEHYLPPFQPSWDGAHLAWLWARFREQTLFFPWFRQTSSARLTSDVPPPSATHTRVLDVLRAGAWYGSAYRAAFAMDGRPALEHLTVPTLITASSSDVLAPPLAGLVTASPVVSQVFATAPATIDASIEFLLGRTSPAATPVSRVDPANAAPVSLLDDAFVSIEGRNVRVRLATRDPLEQGLAALANVAGVVTIVADIGASARQGDDLLRALDRCGVPAFVIEHPGHGETDARATYGPEWLDETLDAMGVSGDTIVAFGMAAAAVLQRQSGSTSRIVVVDVGAGVDLDGARRAGSVEPGGLDRSSSANAATEATYSGSHLLDAWHAVRLGRMFRPWHATVAAACRPGLPDLDPESIHCEVVDLLHAGVHAGRFRREAASIDVSSLADLARGTGVAVTFLDDPADLNEVVAVIGAAAT